jgi:hypothetical protein
MNGKEEKKRNISKFSKEEVFWDDPMCYPTYNAKSLLERRRPVRKESDKNKIETSTCDIAA